MGSDTLRECGSRTRREGVREDVADLTSDLLAGFCLSKCRRRACSMLQLGRRLFMFVNRFASTFVDCRTVSHVTKNTARTDRAPLLARPTTGVVMD